MSTHECEAISGREAALEDAFNALSFDRVTRALVKLSQYLPTMPEALKIEANEVQGCETQTWLACHDGQLFAYSQSRIMRGLLCVVLSERGCEQRCAEDFAKRLSASKQEAFYRLQKAVSTLEKKQDNATIRENT